MEEDVILNISQSVDRYMALSGQNSTSNKAVYLIRGKEIWNQIRKILGINSSKWQTVDKTQLPYRVKLPVCADLFINVAAVNKCNELVPLEPWNGMNAVAAEEPEVCTCETDQSCLTSYSIETEEVIINDEPYEKVTTEIICDGNIRREIQQPVLNINKFTQYVFDVSMIIYDNSETQYADGKVPEDVNFHIDDPALSDIHYYNGIYSNAGGSFWGNASIGNMFRAQFINSDVGVSGYSNRGINEIGGFAANSANAYTSWRTQLENHVVAQLAYGGVMATAVVTHVNQTVLANGVQNNATLTVKVLNSAPDLDFIMLNANSDNEWDFTAGDAVTGWHYDNITLTDPVHKHDSTITDGEEGEVTTVTINEFVCALDVKPCGCIEVSQENFIKIDKHCHCKENIRKARECCQNYFKQPRNVGYITRSDTGYFRYTESERTIYLYGDIPAQVLVNYRTTGEGEDEELMPNYCLMCFFAGMDWLNSKYSKYMNRLEKNDWERQYNKAKAELERELPRNKMNIDTFNKNSINIFAKW